MIDGLHPYPAYKPSGVPWLGDVPEHWEIRRLKETVTIIAGQSPPSEIVSDNLDGLPFLQGNAEFGRMHPNPRMACETPPKRARPGDILLSVRAPVGALNVADQDYGIGRGLCAVRTRPSLNGLFTNYVLGVANQELIRLSTGSTYDAVTVGIIGSLAIPLPPLSEQHAIVRYLDYADRHMRRYVAAKRKLIGLLDEEKQAVVNRAVTRGLDPNVRLKPSGVEWLGVRAGALADLSALRHRYRQCLGNDARLQTHSRGRNSLPYLRNDRVHQWLNRSSVNIEGTIPQWTFHQIEYRLGATLSATGHDLRPCARVERLADVHFGQVQETRGMSGVLTIDATMQPDISPSGTRRHETRAVTLYLYYTLS